MSSDEISPRIDQLKVNETAEPDPEMDVAFSELTFKIGVLQTRLNAERFAFIFMIIVLLDAGLFASYETWAAPVCITVLEILGLVCLGAALGQEIFVSIFYHCINSIGSRYRPSPDK